MVKGEFGEASRGLKILRNDCLQSFHFLFMPLLVAGLLGGGVWGVWGGMGWGVFPVAVIHGVFETGSGFRFSCGMMRCGMFSSFLGF